MPLDNRIKDQIDEKLDELEADINDAPLPDEDEVVENEDLEEEPVESEEIDDLQDPEEPQKKAEPKEPDYKEKFKASTQEAQVLAAKDRRFTETVEKAAQITDVEETELKAEYPDWESMTAIEQRLAKSDLINRKRFELINTTVMEGRKVDEWSEKVDVFLSDDTQVEGFPGLSGREQEFKAFAMKPSRRGLDMEDLVSAFMFQSPLGKAKKGSLLLSGGSSSDHNVKPSKLGADEAETLRKRSPTAYMRAVREGKIQVDI